VYVLFGLPAALLANLSSECHELAQSRLLTLLDHSLLGLCSLWLGHRARVLLIPLVPELHAPRGIPLAVSVNTAIGALIVALIVVQGARRRALSALEEPHVTVEAGLLATASVIWRTALRRPHELIATHIGWRTSARPELLEGHRGTLGPELLRGLHDDRVAALLRPEPVGVALGLGLGSSHRSSGRGGRSRSTTQVGGDVLGSHCASQPDASYEVELQG
jgi:hypothetical protein